MAILLCRTVVSCRISLQESIRQNVQIPKSRDAKIRKPLSCPSQFYLILLPVVSIADQLFLGLVQPQQQDQSSKHMHVDSIWKTTMIATFKYQCRYRTCKHTKRCIYIYLNFYIHTYHKWVYLNLYKHSCELVRTVNFWSLSRRFGSKQTPPDNLHRNVLQWRRISRGKSLQISPNFHCLNL